MIDIIIQHGFTIYSPILTGDVTLDWNRKGAPGKLSFTVISDGRLNFAEGDPVKLTVDSTDMFYGFVFTKSRSSSVEEISVTAYDQLRYLKNKDTYVYSGKTATDVVRMIADDYQLKTGLLEDTSYIIPSRVEDNVTLFDIISNALDETLQARRKMYVLYDDVGRLALQDVEDMRLPLVLDGDTVGNFQYSTSIDKQTYNQIKVTYENKETQKREVYIAKDSVAINRWGLLQYTDKAETATGGPAKAETLLKLYNARTSNLSVENVLGDVRVRAGSSVLVQLDLGDLIAQSYLMVEQVTHKFSNGTHLMNARLRGGPFV